MTQDVSLQPERELYVRWMQVSIFLPVVQFATLPSAFDEAVEKIASELTTLRQTTILPLLQVTKLTFIFLMKKFTNCLLLVEIRWRFRDQRFTNNSAVMDARSIR